MADAVDTMSQELAPLLEQLVALTEDEGESAQRDFFDRILQMVRASRDVEDMAAPFMELSTSAFLGFHFSLPTQLLLDRTLEVAQTFAMTLSAAPESTH